MSLSEKIREQVINSFRAELSEHVQTMTQGLLALEQNTITGAQREETLADIFRAAHSLKGAARAVSVTAIEQLAHALENVLGRMQQGEFQPTTGLFTACYRAIDAIKAVQAAFEAGHTAPLQQALEAIVNLDLLQKETTSDSDESQPETIFHSINSPATDDTNLTRGKSTEKAIKDGLANLSEALSQTEQVEAVSQATSEVTPEPKPVQNLPVPAQNPPVGINVDETIRVSVKKLDMLMAQLSELLISKIHADQLLSEIQNAREFTANWQKEWLMTRNSYTWIMRQNGNPILHPNAPTRLSKEIAKLLAYVNYSQDNLRQMSGIINTLVQQHQSDVMQMSLVIDRLEDEIKRVRMLPLSMITDSFGLMVRDLAQTAGKKVVFEVRGGDVELDKSVLEKIKDPLIHLLRNAVDHGIENPEKRVAAGKPSQGTIVLSAEAIGREVVISVSDDGAGLNIDAIRQSAVRRGIAHTQEMTHDELVQLIYTVGFSTSPIVTDVSGRGIGLDIVRRNIEQLHGKVNVNWKPGMRTRFTLTIPLTLTSSNALLVRASDQWFAIPLTTIERILHIRPEEVTTVGKTETIPFEGQQIMLARLNNVLELPLEENSPEADTWPVVILSSAGRKIAFIVDELGGEQEVVVKTLGKQFIYLGGIAGAHLMGNGDVLLVLNVADIIKLALRGNQSSVLIPSTTNNNKQTTAVQKRSILIVDDSITTRTLEKNILEAAGYNVLLAINGIEALNTIRSSDLPDLVITDVAMPRMDGFILTERIKSEPRTSKIPVILVTSLDSPTDKARGIDCGADAYIVKSSFDQENLLETIQQLI
jgi:two-component system chemotaxis sensor kinase CheA